MRFFPQVAVIFHSLHRIKYFIHPDFLLFRKEEKSVTEWEEG